MNPPTAQRCDCGYDFAAQQVARSYLPDSEHARQRDARLPTYIPTGCVSLVLLVFVAGSNGAGISLALIAFGFGVLVGGIANDGAWVYLLAAGVTAEATDLLARRYLLRCSKFDIQRGSRFCGPPVWVAGVGLTVAGFVLLYMRV